MLDVRVLGLSIPPVPPELQVTALQTIIACSERLLDAIPVVFMSLVVTRVVLVLSHTPRLWPFVLPLICLGLGEVLQPALDSGFTSVQRLLRGLRRETLLVR